MAFLSLAVNNRQGESKSHALDADERIGQEF